ncbi:hypothetical protein Ahy_B06g083433 [Arachis hypogaea]|uniref:Phosphotransferase n=1 Tax=Arachis hypogaea TaxID=3818 RepID=A0A444YQ13_ARAHY|nr:hypothetical protein Ahy_B06g083433 [Arachis hypogaea]
MAKLEAKFGMIVDSVGNFFSGKDQLSLCEPGTNAAYVERANAIPKWHGPLPKSGDMKYLYFTVILELASPFAGIKNALITCKYCRSRSSRYSHWFKALTSMCNSVIFFHYCSQIFEKLISGMYLGNIVRRALLKMAEEADFFVDTVLPKLRVPFIPRYAC